MKQIMSAKIQQYRELNYILYILFLFYVGSNLSKESCIATFN